MTFYEVLEQRRELPQRHGRLSYRALKRQFELDDAYLRPKPRWLRWHEDAVLSPQGEVVDCRKVVKKKLGWCPRRTCYQEHIRPGNRKRNSFGLWALTRRRFPYCRRVF